MPSLFVFQGNDQGVRFELDRDRILVGREASNCIQLHDQEVSRRHAELRCQGNRFVLTDLGSVNGTFLNSQRLDKQVAHELSTGDRVLMGKTLMLFTGASEESSVGLREKVSIIDDELSGDQSRIVRTIGSAEGSQFLRIPDEHTLDANENSWLARARGNLQIMYRTAQAVSQTQDIDQLLHRIMHLVFEWVQADRGCIMLLNPEIDKLEPKVHLVREGQPAGGPLHISQTILDYVREHNEGVLTTNAQDDDRWNPAQSILQQGICEAICVPMEGRYDVVGVMYIDTKTPPHRVLQASGSSSRFSDEHLKLMIAIAHQAALAVEDTRYYSAMLQAERLAAVGQTIASLSHYIKNILQGIRGGSFLIKDGLSRHNEEMVSKGWEFVEKNQEKISNLVMDMLTFSKEREPEMAPAELNEVAGDVVELMQTRAAEKQTRIVFQPDESMPTLTFDADGLHRAVLNLVTNAIDACYDTPSETDDEPHQGLVTVSTQYCPEEQKARIVVEDNGEGIAPEEIKNIFNLFVSTKKSHGTGIGLSVSQKIAQEHSGRIAVDSELGRGSRFTLEIPAVSPEASHHDSDSHATRS